MFSVHAVSEIGADHGRAVRSRLIKEAFTLALIFALLPSFALAAALQTFPKKFKFVEPRGEVLGAPIARHIGNAVPVRLGRIIARSIKRHLEEVDGLRGGGDEK